MERYEITRDVGEKWKKEIAILASDLSGWLSPEAFNARVEPTRDAMPSHVLFKLSDAKTVLEAWAIGKFAALAGDDRVRLVKPDQQWPDGQVQFGEAEPVDIEATQAFEPGRER